MQRVWQQVVALIDGILDFLMAALYVIVGIVALVAMGSMTTYSSGADGEVAAAFGGMAAVIGIALLVYGGLYVLFGVLATRAFSLPSRPGGYFGVGIARLVIVVLTTVPALLSRDTTLEQLGAASGMSYSEIAALTSWANAMMVWNILHLARSVFRVVVAATLRPVAAQQQAMAFGFPYGQAGAYPQPGGYPQQGAYQPQVGGYMQAGGYPQQGAAQQGTVGQVPPGNAGGTWQ